MAGPAVRRTRQTTIAALAAGLAIVAPAGFGAQSPAPLALLERYAAGEFDAVVAELEGMDDFGGLLKDLRRGGQAWIDAAPEADRPRRELAAATFALEAARAGEWKEWKLIQSNAHIPSKPADSLFWKAPPLLIEWGCALFRRHAVPRPTERWWQLAALAVAERAEDFEFLIGSPFEARANKDSDEIQHLTHTSARFPHEPRFALAQGIALDWRTWPERPRGAKPRAAGTREAEQVFASLEKDEAVGAEATVRLGVLRLRAGDVERALELFDRAEDLTRDPYVVYLARFSTGQAFERQKRTADAVAAYRRALAAIPRAQSASMALASLLFLSGASGEAKALAETALSEPLPHDPWREYGDGDDRFWPQLVARLRTEIAPRRVRLQADSDRIRPPRPDATTDSIRLKPDTTGSGGVRLQPDSTGARQVFRSAADLVTVNVTVRTGNTRVGGLKASDFVLLDNGVPQKIESLEMEAVPADVTILVDAGEDMVDYLGPVNSQMQKVATLVRPDDRLRVVAMDTYVREVLPLQRAADRPPIQRLAAGGLASVNDAIAASLLRAGDAGRQHLVIAITDGVDAMSALTGIAVREIARRANATLHIAQVTVAIEAEPPLPPLWTTSIERHPHLLSTVPAARYWRRFHEPPRLHGDRFVVLRETAEASGGALHVPGIFIDRTASGIFKKVYEDYRQSYVLRYTPQGVKREGWHDISVRIPAYPDYAVNARRGYAIEAVSQPSGSDGPAGRPASLTRTRPASLDTVIAAYDRGDFAAAQEAIRTTPDRARLIRDFRAAANPWPATPHREAVLVLELAEVALGAHKDDAREAARDLLAAYNRLVRHPLGPDAFERDWLAAELAMVQGAIKPALADSFVDNAVKRFPGDPRFLLARAIVSDQYWPLGRLADLAGTPPPRIDTVIAHYDAAMTHPATAAEASVRKAWFLHRLGREDDALALLDATGDRAPDASVAYLRHLFRGHVLDSLGRLDAAIDAFRAAVATVPDAQSARVALMNGLQRRGHTADARALAEAIQTTASATMDPWWFYWWGDYRLFPEMLTALRERTR